MVRSTLPLILALLVAPLVSWTEPALAGSRMSLRPVDHRRPPLRAKVWTDRGNDGIYHPGERVTIRFILNDDAYVCVYNIDTEGHVRVLFPAYDHDGFVPANQVVTLPGPHASFDYIVTGPSGIETVEVIASRQGLGDWDQVWEGEGWDEEGFERGPLDDEWEDEDSEGEWEEDGDDNGDLDDPDDDADDPDDDEDGAWEAGSRFEGRPIPSPRSDRFMVSGDPFVAIRRVNRRLLPASCEERDYDTAYVSFFVGERVAYPRYTCNDCHGPQHGYDPYHDHCSVFSVRVNGRWGYPRHHVYVVHRNVLEPRYIYVRERNVPSPYKHLKRTWSSHDRSRLRKEFNSTPAWKSPPKSSPKLEPREKGKRPPQRSKGMGWTPDKSKGRYVQAEDRAKAKDKYAPPRSEVNSPTEVRSETKNGGKQYQSKKDPEPSSKKNGSQKKESQKKNQKNEKWKGEEGRSGRKRLP